MKKIVVMIFAFLLLAPQALAWECRSDIYVPWCEKGTIFHNPHAALGGGQEYVLPSSGAVFNGADELLSGKNDSELSMLFSEAVLKDGWETTVTIANISSFGIRTKVTWILREEKRVIANFFPNIFGGSLGNEIQIPLLPGRSRELTLSVPVGYEEGFIQVEVVPDTEKRDFPNAAEDFEDFDVPPGEELKVLVFTQFRSRKDGFVTKEATVPSLKTLKDEYAIPFIASNSSMNSTEPGLALSNPSDQWAEVKFAFFGDASQIIPERGCESLSDCPLPDVQWESGVFSISPNGKLVGSIGGLFPGFPPNAQGILTIKSVNGVPFGFIALKMSGVNSSVISTIITE